MDLIVRLNRKCTSDKMRDGQTALHLAAANNEVEISHCLITVGIVTYSSIFIIYKVHNVSYIDIIVLLE